MTVTSRIPGLVLTEHEFDVPLDHARPDGERITVFAREVADPDGLDRPFLVFLQGGPGHESPRPTTEPITPSGLGRALRDYRVLFLDQRGTGRSTQIGMLPGMSGAEQARYLSHFRADSIVRDLELIRAELGVEQWSLLGQSFGGFCAVTYLSFAPEALREAYITGGVPPVGRPIEDFYRASFATMAERNRRYYLRYPGDVDRVRALTELIDSGQVKLANGDVMTTRRFQQLGNMLGMTDGAEKLHYLLECEPTAPSFWSDIVAALPFSGRNPLYSLLNEACLADGVPTRWASQRVRPPEFDDPTMFTGEHVFPYVFTDYGDLAPLRECAELLSEHEWPRLYDEERLRSCTVPCAAAIYVNDAYVDRALSEQTAAMIPSMRPWITNEYEHNGLRADGGRILDRLITLARGRV